MYFQRYYVECLSHASYMVADEETKVAAVIDPPHVIFHHDDDTLGPAGHDEWQAFVRDSEGNTVGLVAFQKP